MIENQNDLHRKLDDLNPQLFALSKRVLDSPTGEVRKSETELLSIIQQNHGHKGENGHSKYTIHEIDRKSISMMQEELNFMKTRLEKLVPADQDIRVLYDNSLYEFASLPGLPTYIKIVLQDQTPPCIMNTRTYFDNPQDSIGAQTMFFLSGSSKRPNDNNYAFKYRNVSNNNFILYRLRK